MTGSWLRIALGLPACGLALPAAAVIYMHAEADGTVTLSNVPAAAGFSVLIRQDDESWPPAETGTVRPPAAGPRRDLYDRIIEEAARAHRLDSALLHAVVTVESGYQAQARSPKGASGLMQLMPETARRYGVTDVLDPRQNLQAGARYLRDLLRLFDADLPLALAAYNAGEQRVLRNGRRVPQIRETLDYVPKVLDLYQRYRQRRPAEADPAPRGGAAPGH